MKLIIAGSRHLRVSANFLKGVFVTHGIPIDRVTTVVCGEAEGIDTAGRKMAEALGIKVESHPYKSELGKAGGPARNKDMATSGDGLLLIWNSHSKGSASMKYEARQAGIPIWEVILCNPPAKGLQKITGWIPTSNFKCHDCGHEIRDMEADYDPTTASGCCPSCGSDKWNIVDARGQVLS